METQSGLVGANKQAVALVLLVNQAYAKGTLLSRLNRIRRKKRLLLVAALIEETPRGVMGHSVVF